MKSAAKKTPAEKDLQLISNFIIKSIHSFDEGTKQTIIQISSQKFSFPNLGYKMIEEHKDQEWAWKISKSLVQDKNISVYTRTQVSQYTPKYLYSHSFLKMKFL